MNTFQHKPDPSRVVVKEVNKMTIPPPKKSTPGIPGALIHNYKVNKVTLLNDNQLKKGILKGRLIKGMLSIALIFTW